MRARVHVCMLHIDMKKFGYHNVNIEVNVVQFEYPPCSKCFQNNS